ARRACDPSCWCRCAFLRLAPASPLGCDVDVARRSFARWHRLHPAPSVDRHDDHLRARRRAAAHAGRAALVVDRCAAPFAEAAEYADARDANVPAALVRGGVAVLKPIVDDYLAARRALGFELHDPERMLNDFAAFGRERGESDRAHAGRAALVVDRCAAPFAEAAEYADARDANVPAALVRGGVAVLKPIVDDYLAARRALGFELHDPERMLNDFAAFARERGE